MIYDIGSIPNNISNKLMGKSKNIYQLNSKGLTIPQTWIIPLGELVDRDQLFSMKNIIRYEDIIEKIGINKLNQLLYEIENLFATNPKLRFCVRSSNFDEDGIISSKAGIYNSYVNINNSADLLDKIVWVFLSYFSQGVDETNVNNLLISSSIIIQEFVICVKSGVIYKNRDTLLIECCYGLPQGIVDSVVEPEVYFVDKNKEIEYKLTDKKKTIQPLLSRSYPKKGERIRLLDGNFGEVSKIDEINFLALIEIENIKLESKSILSNKDVLNLDYFIKKNIQERLELETLDIEFGIDRNNKLYIFQVRPITAKVELSLPYVKDELISVCFGTAIGKLIHYKEAYPKSKYDGKIVLIDQIDGEAFYKLENCSGLIIGTSSYLSHSSILARELKKATIGIDIKNVDFDENYVYEINVSKENLNITKIGISKYSGGDNINDF